MLNRGVPLSVVFKPTDPMRERLDRFVTPRERTNIAVIMRRIDTVEGFANLLDRALDARVTSDGRLDMIQLADWITNEMERHQHLGWRKSPAYELERWSMIKRLAQTLDRGFDVCCKSDGTLDMQKLSAFVIDTMNTEA